MCNTTRHSSFGVLVCKRKAYCAGNVSLSWSTVRASDAFSAKQGLRRVRPVPTDLHQVERGRAGWLVACSIVVELGALEQASLAR